MGKVLLFSRVKDSLKEIAIRLLDQRCCKLNVVIGFSSVLCLCRERASLKELFFIANIVIGLK